MAFTRTSMLVPVLAAGLVLPVGSAAPPGAAQDRSPARAAVATRSAGGLTARPWSEHDFRLGPGDKLRIDVYKTEGMSHDVQIRPDGKITMPQVGDVKAAGLTPQELDEVLTRELGAFVIDPVVTVIVQEAISAQVHVIGEVQQPGSLVMRGPMEVLEALAQAGGLREFADKNGIHIQRTVGSRLETIPIQYKRLMKGEAGPLFLQPGDRLVVP